MAEMKKPSWVKLKESELKKIIIELSKKNSPSKIGLILRDQYGIPTTKIFGKKLKYYLEEAGINKNEDLDNAEKKVDGLKDHLKNNITDKSAKHKLQKAQSRLNIIRRYFKIQKKRR